MGNHPNRGERSAASNPTPAEIRTAREAAGLSQSQAGDLIYSGLRSWQHWEAGERRMHPALWELFLLKLREQEGATAPADEPCISKMETDGLLTIELKK